MVKNFEGIIISLVQKAVCHWLYITGLSFLNRFRYSKPKAKAVLLD